MKTTNIPNFCFRLFIALAILAFSPLGNAQAQSSLTQTAAPLKDLQWKKRPLLLFSKSRSDAQLDRQVMLLRDRRPELRDRDMIVLRTSGHEETRSSIGYTPINRGTARALRRFYQPSAVGLTAILVGKDGLEKKRWNNLVDPQVIFDLIDTMPMRQNEMKTSN